MENRLKKIKIKNIDPKEKMRLWQAICDDREAAGRPLLFKHKPMIGLALALLLVIGGGGVVAASDSAKPGEILFKIDLAAEKAQLALAGESKKKDLAVKFATERLDEVRKLREDGSIDDRQSTSVDTVTEIEADVFTNETVIKMEVGDKKFGFTTPAKNREAIVAQIAGKYHLDKSYVESKIDFEIEDRTSRPEDKNFITNDEPEFQTKNSVNLNKKEKNDIKLSFNQAIELLGADVNNNAELKAALTALLAESDNGKIEFKSRGQEIEIESKNGVITIDIENKKGNGDEKRDRDDKDKDKDENKYKDKDDNDVKDDNKDEDDDHKDEDNKGRIKTDIKVQL